MVPRRQLKRHEMTGLSATVAEEKTTSCWKFTWPVEKWEKHKDIESDFLIYLAILLEHSIHRSYINILIAETYV